ARASNRRERRARADNPHLCTAGAKAAIRDCVAVHRWRHGDRYGGGNDLKAKGRRQQAEVRIAAAAVDLVVRHALADAPRECCGLLLADGDLIVEAIAAPNLASDVGRYVIDPRTHISAQRAARARGLSVAGFYHSHP